MAGLVCWNCGASVEHLPRPISRHANCEKCFEVLHCCRMCRWYAPGRPGDCDHDRADPPVEKESANFCEHFSPTKRSFRESEAAGKRDAKNRADALFDEAPGEDLDGEALDSEGDGASGREDPVRSRLDDLFDD